MQDQRKNAAAKPLAGEDGQLLDAKDVMVRLKVSKSTAGRRLNSGDFATVRFGSSVRVRAGDLDAWIARHVVPPLRKDVRQSD